jgi:hypothetical protein
MTNDELLSKIDSLSADQIEDLKAALAPSEQVETVKSPAKPVGKIKCKVCGFHKKPRKGLVETGICKVCTDAVKDGKDGEIEVVGRMGKRGRNSVSVVIGDQRIRVKRCSSKHSERLAAKHASKSKGFAKRPKRKGSEPKGLPTCSRIGSDRDERTPDTLF